MIEPEPLQQVDRTYVRCRGRKLAYFSGCDYFRLSSHPRVVAALVAGARTYGLNVAASRLTTGNHVLYWRLEERLAAFFGAPDALVVASGYVANVVAAQALAGEFTHALIDADAHSSLWAAGRFLDCPLLRIQHHDADDLARVVRRCGRAAKLVLLTDGMFARDGSAAPLAEYLTVLPTSAVVIVDDAHGAGVLGRTGKGTLEQTGVARTRRIIQTVTLSKAFGAYGGAILGTAALRRRVLDRSQWFLGSTPPPLPLVNAALASVKLLAEDQRLRARLAQNCAFVKGRLRAAGLPVADTPGPIVAFAPEQPRETARLKRAFLAGGIFPPFTRYGGGPGGGYFRIVISSEHTPAQLESLVEVLTKAAP
jgi:7-keto-8-aminopelargonate synthetase-like enzyme